MSVLFAAERHPSGVCIATGDEQGELCQRAVQYRSSVPVVKDQGETRPIEKPKNATLDGRSTCRLETWSRGNGDRRGGPGYRHQI